MGSTFVRFRDHGFEANDATLEIWLLLLVNEIDRLPNVPEWLKLARDEWYLQATAEFGFGVMPGLDQVVTSQERCEVILDLCAKAMRRLHDYGPSIAKAELNSITGSSDGGAFARDVKTALFERVGEYFIKLLREELRPDETDSRF